MFERLKETAKEYRIVATDANYAEVSGLEVAEALRINDEKTGYKCHRVIVVKDLGRFATMCERMGKHWELIK